jgi:Aldo/keto reductases, related to diketogulonate reductase
MKQLAAISLFLGLTASTALVYANNTANPDKHETAETERNTTMLNETYTLSNGVTIPKLGLGTWRIDDDKAAEAVRQAVKIGYRHIDTAQGYGNERGIGEGIRSSGIPRDQIFVTTKLAGDAKTYEAAAAGIEQALQLMGLDYIDMMLIHSPQPWHDFRGGNYDEGNRAIWKAMEEAYKAGKLKAIGVSNFEARDIENILSTATVPPMVNQILVHISNTPFDLIAYSQSKGILVEAYSPIAHGEMLKNKEVADMAAKYGVTIPQLCIRYTLQLGTLPLPKTGNPRHMLENTQVDFEISEADMTVLKNIAPIENYGEANVYPVFGIRRDNVSE